MQTTLYQQWKAKLIALIMREANLQESEVATNENEIEAYYNAGRTIEEVYFEIWMQDAGNYFNCAF